MKLRNSFVGIGLVIVLTLAVACSALGISPQAAQNAEDIQISRPSAPAKVDGDFRADYAEHVAATGNPQLVEFFAYWCTVCNAMKPIIHGLEAEYWGEVDFVYLDIDDPANSDLMSEFGFTAQPLYVLLSADGEEVQRWFGYNNADDFRQAMDGLVVN